ncbi:hypothetical protein EYZ11_012043 [Aspergillus tanneri]|uniref:Stc1 domain-containing protein n=1 Tax=Aspergillus tanneri TaxID=1220188 RepID=A0A4S3J185_9EURO|nr:uncharacterized protein ATNIH1004_008373 [Aspergillus tanneri]KAA8644174.1 hypothetical protein ATNIH1004_008373 [Aspergillus tanneri]THC88509.1 hypothetical protein EYZ11_012043 [Aspergillus tanneri]
MGSRGSPGQGPSGVRSAYAGGYSEAIKRQLENCALPDKKFRIQSAFSKRQLDVLRNAIVVQGPRAATAGHAKCRTCVGGPTVELSCCICDQIKGLEEFAKNQRHNRDSARCLNCVQGHAETEPVLEENKLMTESEHSTQGTITSRSQIDDESYLESTRRLALNEEGDDEASSAAGGIWLEKDLVKLTSESRSTTCQLSAIDPLGNPRRSPAAQSGAGGSAIHKGWDSWGVTDGASKASGSLYNNSNPTPKRSSNFAKVPGKRFEKTDAPTMRTPEPASQNVESDNEDDEAGVEDYL